MTLLRKTIAAVLCAVLLAVLSIPSLSAGAADSSLFGITDITFVKGIACVNTVASNDCTLVLAFFNENATKMLCGTSAAVEFPEGAVSAQPVKVSVDCSKLGLPRYFTVKAYLLDSHLHPLCPVFTTNHCTEAFHAFSQKNAVDYITRPYISFTADGESFAALKKGAQVVVYNGKTNLVKAAKDKSGSYVFSEVDRDIKKLEPGDVLYYRYGEASEEYILIKIGSIDYSNDTTCVVSAAPAELSDLFDCVKIDLDLIPEIDTTKSLETGVTYSGKAKDGSFIYDIAGKWLTSEVNGQLQLKTGAHFSLYYDRELFGENYYEVSLTSSVDTKLESEISKKISKTISLLPVTFTSPLKGISASFTPSFTFATDGACSINASQSVVSGFDYSTKFGFGDTVKVPGTLVKGFDSTSSVNFQFGIDSSISLTALKNCQIDTASSEASSLAAAFSNPAGGTDGHTCGSCTDIAATDLLSCKTGIKIGRNKTSGILSHTYEMPENAPIHYYNSSENGFGTGTCPSAPAAPGKAVVPAPNHEYTGKAVLAGYSPDSGAISFNRMAPLSEFTVILVKDARKAELLSADNLVYIGQTTSDEDGLINLNYSSAVKAESCNALVIGAVNGNDTCVHIPRAWTSTVIPPCKLVGIDTVYCAKCGEILSERTVPGKEHEWGEWEIIKAATLEHGGSKRHTCALCGEVETVGTDKLNRYEFPIGDIDGNFKVTAEDARLALRQAVGLEKLTGGAFECADVDGDKSVSSSDARLILRIAVGLEKSDKKIIVIR